MSASSLADMLPDFGTGPAPAGRGRSGGLVELAPSPASPGASPKARAGAPPDTGAAETEAARAEAEAALRAELAREHEEALAAERRRHAEELEALHGELGEKAGALIEERISDMERRIVDLTSSLAARVLGVALTEDLQKRSVERLSAIIGEALSEREAVRVRVHGAPPMFKALETALGDKAARVEFSEGPGFDLTVAIDDGVFETRISEWSEALAEVVS